MGDREREKERVIKFVLAGRMSFRDTSVLGLMEAEVVVSERQRRVFPRIAPGAGSCHYTDFDRLLGTSDEKRLPLWAVCVLSIYRDS